MTTNQTTYVKTDLGQTVFGGIRLAWRLWIAMWIGVILYTILLVAWKFILVALVALVVLSIILRSRSE